MAATTFTVEIHSNVKEILAADLPALVKATRKIVAGRGKRLAGAIRAEMRRAGLGARLAGAIKHKSHDTEDGVESVVYSKAISGPYTDPGGGGRTETVDLAGLLQAALIVTPDRRRMLAIPLPAAGRGPRGRAARVSDFPEGYFRAIFKPGASTGILVAKEDRGRKGQQGPLVPLFLLTTRTRRPQFISSSQSWERYAREGLNDLVFDEWSRHRSHIALQRVA